MIQNSPARGYTAGLYIHNQQGQVIVGWSSMKEMIRSLKQIIHGKKTGRAPPHDYFGHLTLSYQFFFSFPSPNNPGNYFQFFFPFVFLLLPGLTPLLSISGTSSTGSIPSGVDDALLVLFAMSSLIM